MGEYVAQCLTQRRHLGPVCSVGSSPDTRTETEHPVSVCDCQLFIAGLYMQCEWLFIGGMAHILLPGVVHKVLFHPGTPGHQTLELLSGKKL